MKNTIVILANSVKHGAHCVAGKCIGTAQWVRPVSTPNGGALSNDQIKYENVHGTFFVKPLQNIEMTFSRAVPLINQPENFLITEDRWQQKFSTSPSSLSSYIDTPDSLWGSGDRVAFGDIESGRVIINQSLFLVKVSQLNLYKNGTHRRANFVYNGVPYDLAVTCPQFDFFLGAATAVNLGDRIVCISLGESFMDYCYKLIASIFLNTK